MALFATCTKLVFVDIGMTGETVGIGINEEVFDMTVAAGSLLVNPFQGKAGLAVVIEFKVNPQLLPVLSGVTGHTVQRELPVRIGQQISSHYTQGQEYYQGELPEACPVFTDHRTLLSVRGEA